MGFGMVIAKLRYFFPPTALAPPSRGMLHASNIGLLFTVIGLLTIILAVKHFTSVQLQIREQRYQASNRLVLMFSTIIMVLGLLILGYLLEGTLSHWRTTSTRG
jgi:uncharacterized membrane protein YidH (DUF202 family)